MLAPAEPGPIRVLVVDDHDIVRCIDRLLAGVPAMIHVFPRLGVQDRLQAARWARRHGLGAPD
jgi:hypothetical protein